MTESALRFGTLDELVGVLNQPAQPTGPSVAFLLFNAGVLTRIGAHRMNVKLARALSRSGQTSLRFDFSGQGDSRLAAADQDFRAQAVRDLRCAMDYLELHEGVIRFALIGICSGAVLALRAAVEDRRVVGVLMFDGHWYPARWTVLARRWKRWREMSWADITTLTWRAVFGSISPGVRVARPAGDSAGALVNPPRDGFVRSLGALADRRVAMYFIYSGSVIDQYSYANQFRDAFGHEPFFPKVRCDFRPDIDHTFLTLETQRRMIGLVEGWVVDVQRACAPLP